MIDPDQIFQPADELAQRVPIGGADELGHEILQAPVPVQAVGLVTIRVPPALIRVSGYLTVDASGTPMRLVGATPQRRRLVVSATQDIYLCDSENSAANTYGFFLPFGRTHEIFDAGDVWVKGIVADTRVTYWHEMDAG